MNFDPPIEYVRITSPSIQLVDSIEVKKFVDQGRLHLTGYVRVKRLEQGTIIRRPIAELRGRASREAEVLLKMIRRDCGERGFTVTCAADLET